MSKEANKLFIPISGSSCDCRSFTFGSQGPLKLGEEFNPCNNCPYYNPNFPVLVIGDPEQTVRLNKKSSNP